MIKLPWRRKRSPSPPLPLDLEPFEGRWVAVSGGRVRAFADTAREIVDKVEKRGIRSATLFHVARSEEIQRWAVQLGNGRVCPNCMFDTREKAEYGVGFFKDPGAVVVTRDGQFDPWRPVESEETP